MHLSLPPVWLSALFGCVPVKQLCSALTLESHPGPFYIARELQARERELPGVPMAFERGSVCSSAE